MRPGAIPMSKKKPPGKIGPLKSSSGPTGVTADSSKIQAQISSPQIRQAVFALVYTAVVLTILEHVFLPFRVAAWLYPSPDFIARPVPLMAGVIWAVAC